jgi:hypothetical protein
VRCSVALIARRSSTASTARGLGARVVVLRAGRRHVQPGAPGLS